MRPALFMDRDGVICADCGYVRTPAEVVFLPGALSAIRRVAQLRAAIVIVTNQSGVGRGILSLEELHSVNGYVADSIVRAGGRIDAIYWCPHHPTEARGSYCVDCDCRKPKPGMLRRASQDLDLDLNASVMVGDRITDVEAGRRAGTWTVLVGTTTTDLLRQADGQYPSLDAALQWITTHLGCERRRRDDDQ